MGKAVPEVPPAGALGTGAVAGAGGPPQALADTSTALADTSTALVDTSIALFDTSIVSQGRSTLSLGRVIRWSDVGCAFRSVRIWPFPPKRSRLSQGARAGHASLLTTECSVPS